MFNIFGVSLPLLPYFVHARDKGSGDAELCTGLSKPLLPANRISTKVLYAFPFAWVKVLRINPVFRILRPTFHRRSASNCSIREIIIASLINFQIYV